MPTITFQCGNCHDLMAVEDHLLGQQLRCPHWQPVVVVPASTSSASSTSESTQLLASRPTGFSSFPVDFPTVSSGSNAPHHEDDIFMSPAPVSDDLFGAMEKRPAVEMPPEPESAAIPQASSEPSPLANPESGPVTEVMNPASPGSGEITPPSPPTHDWPATSSSDAVSELPPEMVGTDLG